MPGLQWQTNTTSLHRDVDYMPGLQWQTNTTSLQRDVDYMPGLQWQTNNMYQFKRGCRLYYLYNQPHHKICFTHRKGIIL